MSNKLHPVYVALDSHQFSRAAKLAAALPPSNLLGRALLAYAFYKSGQPEAALTTIEKLLGWNYSQVSHQSDSSSATATTSSNNRNGDSVDHKGKDKVLDIIDQLDNGPSSVDWTADFLPSNPCPIGLADDTVLETISITLHGLQKPEMLYRMFSWAGQNHPSLLPYTLPKQYAAGMQVLIRSNETSILASMQALVLQLSRQSPTYQAWAARTALWQWQFTPDKEKNDPTNVRLNLLPRLAESLAQKVVEITGTTEDCLLLLEVLKSQSKWTEMKDTLPSMVKLPQTTRFEFHAMCCEHLNDWTTAQTIYCDLLRKQSGQWSYWKALIKCSLQKGGFEEASTVCEQMIHELTQHDRPTRSILLVHCQLAKIGLDLGCKTSHDLLTVIQQYAETFCSEASCVFSDLEPYLAQLLKVAQLQEIEELAVWANKMRIRNTQGRDESDRFKLRTLIFTLQVLQKLNQLPPWTEIVASWAFFPTTTDGVQKENEPSDDLLLLAVDQLLGGNALNTTQDYLAGASLLEMGLRQSPHNPNLKLRLISVYQALNAGHRCWELFQDLGIKHIQVDSCTYFILPVLLESAMYQQALTVANETLKFHISTLSDTSDFVSRSLEHGTWSKADEFLCFQRNRMSNSLVLLESKGIIMDCAPLLSDASVGAVHGVVGNDDDVERAKRIMEQAHNRTGAPSIITITNQELEQVSDNRDQSILPNGMSIVSQEVILDASLRRKFYHGILIRAAVVLDAAKGPKKGKLIKSSVILIGRSNSLLRVLEEDRIGSCPWMQAIAKLAKVIVVVSSGLPITAEDSLKTREDRATILLREATACISGVTEVGITTGAVGRIIVDHLVSFMALVKMALKVFQTFGWSKRKKKDIVSAIADFSTVLKQSLVQMTKVANGLGDIPKTFGSAPSDVLDESVWNEVCSCVVSSKTSTSLRLMTILNEFIGELSED